MSERISTGSTELNDLLKGGYESDIVTMIYGGPGCGKTNLVLMAAAKMSNQKKVIFIDTEGSFSIERFGQLCQEDKCCIDNILIMSPTIFSEQKSAFAKLKELTKTDSVGLIIVDSIAMLYRLEIGKTKNIQGTNRELGQQIAYLSEIARKKKIPVIITNQIYKDFEDKNKINIVGGDILKYWGKCLIEIRKLDDAKRVAILRKHRSQPENQKLYFNITNEGIKALKTENENNN